MTLVTANSHLHKKKRIFKGVRIFSFLAFVPNFFLQVLQASLCYERCRNGLFQCLQYTTVKGEVPGGLVYSVVLLHYIRGYPIRIGLKRDILRTVRIRSLPLSESDFPFRRDGFDVLL